MERKLRGLLVILGVLIMGSIASAPLSSHAANNVYSGSAPVPPAVVPNPGSTPPADDASEDVKAEYQKKKAAYDRYQMGAYTPNDFGCDYDKNCADRVNDNGSQQVNLIIKDYLTLDAAAFTGTAGGTSIQAYPDMTRKGTLSAAVWSAKNFTISLSAEQPYLTNVEDDGLIIQARSTPEAGKSGWGIKKKPTIGDVTDDTSYTAITSAPQVFYEGPANDNEGELVEGTTNEHAPVTYNFEVGVWVNDKTPQGLYTTEVTVTAAIKE